MSRLICWLFGHRWSHGYTGLSKPGTWHYCVRCERLERKR